jgi:hypothetical protein
LISLISVPKSEFSRVLAYPTTRNATKTSPTQRSTTQTGWNAYKALVDLPEDESDSSFDGRDGKPDGTDGKSAVNAPQRVFAAETTAAASSQRTPTGDPPLHLWYRGLITAVVNTILHDAPMDGGPEKHFQYSTASLCAIDQANIEIQWRLTTFEDNVWDSFHAMFGRLDSLLTKMDTVVNENTVLRAAYDASKQESAALKAAVDTLPRKIDEPIATLAPLSLDLMASSTMMEDMTMQLSVLQHDIQDVLQAVRNPPGKRKRCTSNQDAEPTMPMNR